MTSWSCVESPTKTESTERLSASVTTGAVVPVVPSLPQDASVPNNAAASTNDQGRVMT